MEKSPARVPLLETDVKKIRRERLRMILFMLLFLLIAISVMFFFIVVKAKSDTVFLVFFSVFLLFFIGVFVFIVYTSLSKYADDLRNGIKLCISGTVISKFRIISSTYKKNGKSSDTSYTYFLNISSTIQEVSYDIYKKGQQGCSVELEIAPLSKVVLAFKKECRELILKLDLKETLLSEEETNLLKSKRNKRIVKMFLLTLLWIFLSELVVFILLIAISIKDTSSIALQLISFGILCGFPVFWMGSFVWRTIKVWRSFSKDIGSGVKEVFISAVDELIQSNAKMPEEDSVIDGATGQFYHISFEEKKLAVTKEIFESMKKKPQVRISRSKLSGLIFGIEML
ncbi:MAG: hypothetical protein ACJ76F_03555 [Bacteroidia bacterium]